MTYFRYKPSSRGQHSIMFKIRIEVKFLEKKNAIDP